MRARILPGGTVGGESTVPGDKSIAHRWLILAATAMGRSVLHDLPPALDVAATARCLARLAARPRPSLEEWASKAPDGAEAHRFTWEGLHDALPGSPLVVEAEGRGALEAPTAALDCTNSGTTMRLLAGVVASGRFRTVLTGDDSLLRRPMDRVAEPLRAMGASVRTTDGRPPMEVEGGDLRGIRHIASAPSAQVKGCLLLAGVAASGTTTVEEPAATRDHTERALAALGAPVEVGERTVTVAAFQHEGFEGTVPGDVSSAAFLVAAAALTGSSLRIRDVGLNPSRTGFLEVLARIGVRTERHVWEERLGEPVGDLLVHPAPALGGTVVAGSELPLVIDEVPVLALLAAHAEGESRFSGAGELRVKESDRLDVLAEGIRGLGGEAAVEGDDLVVAGGGLGGGWADAHGDHRMAMALAVGALGADTPCEVWGVESAAVSFPGFVPTLVRLGARVEG